MTIVWSKLKGKIYPYSKGQSKIYSRSSMSKSMSSMSSSPKYIISWFGLTRILLFETVTWAISPVVTISHLFFRVWQGDWRLKYFDHRTILQLLEGRRNVARHHRWNLYHFTFTTNSTIRISWAEFVEDCSEWGPGVWCVGTKCWSRIADTAG